MSHLAQVLARVHDTIEYEYDVYPDHDGLAGLIDAELRDDDDLMYALAAVVAIMATDFADEGSSAKLVASLGFIGSAIMGLVGVIGTFRPKGPATAATQTGDVNIAPTDNPEI